MFMKRTWPIMMCLALIALPNFALAYIGPGAGITFLGALIGLVLAVLSAISYILFWPFRRVWKRIRARKEKTETMDCQDHDAQAADAKPLTEDPEREGAPADN